MTGHGYGYGSKINFSKTEMIGPATLVRAIEQRRKSNRRTTLTGGGAAFAAGFGGTLLAMRIARGVADRGM